ncbi:MAG: PUR family DNA/RNA-binding protein [Bacteroidia bacterium]|nr:PUR family DNA/RNA-binding protein [Bacteroidia bacterium]
MEDNKNNHGGAPRQDIFSKTIKAGKRTYFFDVRATRANDYYLTITESKRRFNPDDEKHYYEKHKLFLYKEDFDKFADGFKETIEYIKAERPEIMTPPRQNTAPADSTATESDTVKTEMPEVKFEDLGGSTDTPAE